MRASKKLRVLVAGSLLALANAQASEYGDPYGNSDPGPTGNSGGWQAPNGGPGSNSPGNSGNWPSPSDSQGPGSSGNAGDWPGPKGQGSGPSGSPSGYGGSSGTNNAPGSSGDSGDTSPWQNPSGETAPSPNDGGNGNGQSSPTCPFQSTTTVFVTVQPSNVIDPAPTSDPSGGWGADGSSTDNSSPDGSSDSSSNGDSDGSSPDGTSNDPSSEGSDPGSSDGSSTQNPSSSTPADQSNSGNAPPYGSDDSSSNPVPSEDSASDPSGNSPSDDFGPNAGDSQPGDSGELPVTSAFSADPVSGTGDTEPFTTITIDIWGTGRDSAPSASAGPTDPSSASPYGDDGTSNTNGNGDDPDAPPPQASGPSPDGSSGSDSGSGSTPSDNSNDFPPASSGVPPGPDSSNPDDSSGVGSADPNNGSDANSGDSNDGSGSDAPPYGSLNNGAPHETRPFVTHGRATATGSDQDWPYPPKFTSSPNGSPSGSDSSDAGAPADGSAPSSATVTGPDGQPTVVTHPWGHGSDGDSDSFPADTYNSAVGAQSADPVSGGAEDPFITPFPNGASSDPSSGNSNPDGVNSGPSTCITILGNDGKATVVEWPWINTAAPGQPGPVITNGPSSGDSDNSEGSANPGDDAIFTSVTILGDDGKPTVVNWPPPGPGDNSESGQGPAVTVTVGPDGSGSNDGGILTDGDALPLPGASQTCITVLGTDGQPTVVDWPLTSASEGNASSQGPVITSSPGDDASGDSGVLTNGGAFPGPEETCVTILGSDGQPTVVDWPWTNTGGSGASGPVVTSGPFGDGSQGDNSGPVITSGPFGNGQGGNSGPVVDGSTLPQGATVTCTSLTLLGDDGKPTVVETSWVVSPANATPGSGSGTGDSGDLTGLPDGISAQFPGPSNGAGQGAGDLSTTCFTVIGDDGQPTVIESTFLPSDGAGPFIPGPGATLIPGSDASDLPMSGDAGEALSTTYTVIGPDGQPSVVETTWIASPASNTGSPVISGAGAPVSAPAGQITGVPGSPVPGIPQNGGGITTCTTYTVIGPDGLPSAVETSWVIPSDGTGADSLPQLTSGIEGAPWSAFSDGPAAPSVVTAGPISGLGGLPNGQGIPAGASTTCITVMTTGTDGILTPVEQTVVLPPTAAPLPGDLTAQSSLPLTTGDVPGAPQSGPIVSSGDFGGNGEDPSNLSGYDNGASAADAGTVASPNGPLFPPIITDGASDPLTAGEHTSTITRTGTITSTVFANPIGGSQPSGVSPPAYGDGTGSPLGDAIPPNGLPGGLPSESTLFPGSTSGSPAGYGSDANAAGTPITSTWTNAVADQTTTHLVNFPLTTLATLKARHVRRQDSPGPWGNASEPVTDPLPPVTPLPSETPALPIPVPPTNGSSTEPAPSNPGPAPPVCPTGGKIGNSTVNFDTTKAGPLFNPENDLWFSEGFVIAPPSSQSSQAFVATSGGQLVEFVPASIVPNGQAGGSDVAEVGMGVNSASPCYRFNFYGASLGCAAQAPEAWCEFEISAYRWNPATSQEEPIAVSETKRVPACPTFPQGPCALTPVEFEGYTDITGVLISTRVGLEARPWWGDDFRFGWTDNSCTAAACRAANGVANRIKRETLKTALRRGVWHYTPEGMERLHDDYIWNAVH